MTSFVSLETFKVNWKRVEHIFHRKSSCADKKNANSEIQKSQVDGQVASRKEEDSMELLRTHLIPIQRGVRLIRQLKAKRK